ncbi:hypothetical protein [Streptomyces sp. NPDC001530]|uniref:hypothetical protein n=1 Tax=Streptomyces sp. NPDC001530 TaxID=3364582 RepID=UPI00369A2EF0
MTQSSADVIDKMIAAVHARNCSVLLDILSEDASLDDWGRRYTGREQIEAWLEKEIVDKGIAVTVMKTEAIGPDTVLTVLVHDGASTTSSHVAIKVTGEKISDLTIRA